MKKSLRSALALVIAFATLFSIFGSVAVFAEDLETLGEDFNGIVDSIKDATGLVEKKEKLDIAEAKLLQYKAAGGSEQDELIAEAYAIYQEQTAATLATIEACIEFINIVELAQNEELSYPELRAYLDEAALYLDKIDKTYTGVSMASQAYGSIVAELQVPEKNSALFISTVEDALKTTDYASGLRVYELATDISRLLEIDDYPGIEKAKADLAAFKSGLDMIKFKASTYILAVDNLSSAESMLKAIADAKAMESQVDFTVDRAAEAKANLAAFEKAYNEAAQSANEFVSDANSFVFGFFI